MTLAAAARCHGCDWTASGTPDGVDKAAERHTRAGHQTATMMRPA